MRYDFNGFSQLSDLGFYHRRLLEIPHCNSIWRLAESALRSSRRFRGVRLHSMPEMPFWPYNRRDPPRGGMGERLIPAVLKTVVPERVPGVRIPLPPPFLEMQYPRKYPRKLQSGETQFE